MTATVSISRVQARSAADRGRPWRHATVGLLLTLVVVLAEMAGWLAPLDGWLGDWRCRYCQHLAPPPTDQLVHVDIDDAALEAIGAWPWPRTELAEMLSEIHRAGAKAVALDVILAEPQALV